LAPRPVGGLLVRFTLAALTIFFAPVAVAVTLIGEVVGVADGDTLTLLTADKVQHQVRIDGIDAPERTQPHSQVAKQSLSDMVYRHAVTAECSKVDRYGRDVCKVTIDGQDVGLMQIRRGLAWHFKRYAREQSPEDRRVYAQAETEARAAKRGLWRDAAPLPPWEFRGEKRAPAQ
jgi:endonuclease YncB( thermonuclease family)